MIGILWTEPSLDDLKAVRDYIARDSETCAGDFVDSILSAVERLRMLPRMGRVVPEADSPDIRELIFRDYRITLSVGSKCSTCPVRQPRLSRYLADAHKIVGNQMSGKKGVSVPNAVGGVNARNGSVTPTRLAQL